MAAVAAATTMVLNAASPNTSGAPSMTTAGTQSAEPAPLVHRAPNILDHHHQPAIVDEPAKTNMFWVAHDVTGLSSCPPGWACFYEHRNFNQESGWMALAQVQGEVYEFLAPYDNAVASVANKMTVDLALYREHGAAADWIAVHPGESAPNLDPFSRSISSMRIFTDALPARSGQLHLR
jgi:hypothetical protein